MAAQLSDNLTITSVQARKAMLQAFKSKRPIFLWGPPGIGKSEVVSEVTSELGGHMIDLRMAQMEPTDIRGIPICAVSLSITKIQAKWIGLHRSIYLMKNLQVSIH